MAQIALCTFYDNRSSCFSRSGLGSCSRRRLMPCPGRNSRPRRAAIAPRKPKRKCLRPELGTRTTGPHSHRSEALSVRIREIQRSPGAQSPSGAVPPAALPVLRDGNQSLSMCPVTVQKLPMFVSWSPVVAPVTRPKPVPPSKDWSQSTTCRLSTGYGSS